MFNSDGFGQGDITIIPTACTAPYTDCPNWGTPDTPVTVKQTVSGLAVGTRYRLQFYAASEDSTVTNPQDTQWYQTGVAGLDITGYQRTYFTVTHASRYLTIDFVATASDTTIAFLNWG